MSATEESPTRTLSNSLLTPVSTRRVRRGITYNRLLSVGIFTVLVVVSYIFNYSLQKVDKLLASEQAQIEKLQEIIDDQAEVIRRFNDTVSNKDVLERVDALQDKLETAETNMNARVENLEDETHDLLNKTIDELDNSIVEAKGEIHTEVDQVKESIKNYARSTQDQFSMENSFMVYQLAGTFTVIGCLISMWHMTDHLRNFHEPFVQRKILAILWMCPIYSITSWLSLVFVSSEGYLAIIKDFYEAYCIYMFLSFIIAVLGRGDREAVVTKLARHADHLAPPFRLFGCCTTTTFESDRAKADAVLMQCQFFAMQFVFFRPLISTLNFTFNELDYYGGGTDATDWRSPQFWLSIMNNISVFVAFSGLLKIYHAVNDDLSWYRPLPKFLCIKGVVFMTFWQGLAISILARSYDDGKSVNPVLSQSFLICLEMLLFSIAHFYVFPTEEWKAGYRPIENADAKFGDNLALRDFFSDIKLILGSDSPEMDEKKRKSSKKKKKSKKKNKKKTDDDSDSKLESVEEGVSDDENVEKTEDKGQSEKIIDEIANENEVDIDEVKELRKSLSSKNPDVKDATERVLSNPFFLNFLKDSKSKESSSSESAESLQKDEKEIVEEETVETEVNEKVSLLGQSNNSPPSYDQDSSSGPDEILRPSIFTTLAKLNNEKDEGKLSERFIV